jgi:hypothetical protein
MEKRLVLRGFGVGAIAGLLAFVFSRLMAEPVIQRAIDYEDGRDSALAAIRRAAGLAADPAGPDLFSRGVQRNIGIATGLVVFGIAMGGLFAVAYVIAYRRTRGTIRPRNLALMIAGAGFTAIYLVPFLKYPANPPSIGHQTTIAARSELYVAMVALSAFALAAAVFAARRLARHWGAWYANILCGLAFVAVMSIVMAILPPLGHLHSNVLDYGRHATETPLPLTNAKGVIVYPGFSADDLFRFRLYSVIDQVILWGTLGLGFGSLVERALAYVPRPTEGIARPAGPDVTTGY